MVARRSLLQGLRLGTLAVLLGGALSPSDVGAQLPVAGSDPEKPAPAPEEGGIKPSDWRRLSTSEMVSLAEAYGFEIANSVAKVEAARKEALGARDGIKVSCIDQLLPEMRMIRDALAPRFQSISRRGEDFTARADFLVIAPGRVRVRELREEAEGCLGEAIDSSRVFSIGSEPPAGAGSDAQTDPPARDVIVDRPTEASIYR
jgi:hypothetical protein